MPHTIDVSGTTATIRTSGTITVGDQLVILESILHVVTTTASRYVMIDFSTATLAASLVEAHDIGQAFGKTLAPFEDLVLAILVMPDSDSVQLADISVMMAKKHGLRITCFTDSRLMIEKAAMVLQGIR